MKYNPLHILILLLLLIGLSTYTVIVHDAPEFLFILIFLSTFSLLYKKEARDLYLLSFAVNIIFGCILIYVYQLQGSFFDEGGDDKKFYGYFLDGNDGVSILFNLRYGNYIFFGSSFISFLKYAGIEEISPLFVYPLNWFYGANTCALTFILAKQIGLTRSQSKVSASLLAIYPFFVYSEIKMLREILATFMLVLFLVTYYSSLQRLYKIIIILIIAFVLAGVRGEFILYMLLFFGIDVFFNLYSSNKKRQAYILLISGLILGILSVGFFMQITGKIDQGVGDISQSYSELRSSTNENSLGTVLKNGGPVFLPIIILYLWISPFPPPAIQVFNAVYFIITIGVIFWYQSFLKFPTLVIHYLKNNVADKVLKTNTIKVLTFLLIGSSIISLTSADARHITSLYPLVFIIYRSLIKEYPIEKMKNLNSITGMGTVFLFFVYLILKGF